VIFFFYDARRGGWLISEDDVLMTAEPFVSYAALLAWAVEKEFVHVRA
jgi:hypothetical protein